MNVQDDVPYTVEDLTAEWLSEGLKESGVLEGAAVTGFTMDVLGDQVGFNGEVVIIAPTYSPPSASAPASLVLKIPTASKNRIMGQTMGLYEKEIRFYRDLQPGLNIRTPRHYFSALDVADDPDVILERLRGMNRLPIWMIRGIVALANRFVSGNPRRYALLIEDLSGYRMGDQAAGCSDEDARHIVAAMARLHAQFWASETLDEKSWITPYAVTSRIMQMSSAGFERTASRSRRRSVMNQPPSCTETFAWTTSVSMMPPARSCCLTGRRSWPVQALQTLPTSSARRSPGTPMNLRSTSSSTSTTVSFRNTG
jgi:hypothetical protein